MYIHLHTSIYRNILLQNTFIPDIYMYIDGIFKFSFLLNINFKKQKRFQCRIRTHDVVHISKLPWPLRCQRDKCYNIITLRQMCRTSGAGPAAPTAPVTWVTSVSNVTSVPSGRAQPRPAATQAAWRWCGCTPKQPSAQRLPSDSEVCKFRSSESDCRAATQARTLAQAIKSDLTPLQSAIKLFVWASLN